MELDENPLSGAIRGWVFGIESFLKRAIVLASGEASQKRQRTARRIKAVSMEKVVPETAADYDLEEQDYIEFRCTAAGREIAAYLCLTWTGEPLSPISERFGLSHPDSSSNLIRRAKK
ncbi:MAG: hypothetical protein O2931_16605 [Planctomycetota bacterium]|nr:hypothetical protein [Planctomycetota bacterium]MDA1180402.1 hypothetical protein [Planctomycetota bacterium]